MAGELEVYRVIDSVKHKICDIPMDEAERIQLCKPLDRKEYEVVIYLKNIEGYIDLNTCGDDILIIYRHINKPDDFLPILDGHKIIGIDLDIFGEGNPFGPTFATDILLCGYYFRSEIVINDISEIRTILIEPRAPRTNIKFYYGPSFDNIQHLDGYVRESIRPTIEDREERFEEAYLDEEDN